RRGTEMAVVCTASTVPVNRTTGAVRTGVVDATVSAPVGPHALASTRTDAARPARARSRLNTPPKVRNRAVALDSPDIGGSMPGRTAGPNVVRSNVRKTNG